MPSRTSSQSQSRPASEPYGRLISRFFEGLLTVMALGQFRGDRVSTPQTEENIQSVRREFEENLAFLCDFQKGGSSTSAGALENSRTCYKFWIASNNDHSNKTVPFLEKGIGILGKTSQLDAASRVTAEEELIRMSIEFAHRRIKEEQKLVLDNAKLCMKRLDLEKDSSLIGWLAAFVAVSTLSTEKFCQHAYNCRRDPQMKTLAEIGRNVSPEDSTKGSPFEKTKHYIGRLAHHIRAPKQLMEASTNSTVANILQSCEVCPVPRMPSVAKPKPVKRTQDPDLICNRLDFERGSEEREAFIEMDRKHDLTAKIVERHKQDNFCHGVHAEIQVLEHFSRNRLVFVEKDRFVACSKPACYCCHLYFLKHPLRPVEPETHKKIYPSWAPPALREGLSASDPEFIRQRKILIEMLTEIKADAKEQILQRRGPHPFHQDSTTGITNTVCEHEAAELIMLGMERLRVN